MNKRVILLAMLTCIFSISFSQTTISTFPYTEGFETGTGGWSSSGTLSSWARGIPGGAVIGTAASGQNAWVTNLIGDYNNNELSYLESPTLNFSALTADPILYFSHTFITETNFDEGWVETSTNGGLTWTKLLDNGALEWYNDLVNQWWEGTSSAGAGTWVNAENILLGMAGVPNAKIRFVFSSDGSVTEEGFGVDNIRIQLPPAEDAKMVGVLSPISSCGLGSAEQVCIRVMNNGSDTLLSIPIAYSLNNAAAVVDTINSTLLPGDSVTHCFSTTANLSTIATYTLNVYTDLNLDGNRSNDSITYSFNSIITITTLPYTEGFESGNGGWVSYGNNSSWAWGRPTAPNISSAAGGSNAWVTNLSGNYNDNEFSYLESPCIDFSSLTADPILYFSHTFETEVGFDEGWVETSIDGGISWTKLLDNGNAQEWYNDTINQWWEGVSSAGLGAWVNAEDTLSTIGGRSNVKIRFVFSSDGSVTYEGFGVDNIRMDLPPLDDAKLALIESPTSGCGLGNADSVCILIANTGQFSISRIPVSYTINSGTVVTETFNGTILPGDTAKYCFSTTANLSTPGDYNVTTYTDLRVDGNRSNDTARSIVTSIPIVSTFPYLEDFELGNGGWTTSGTNSSWAWGNPNAPNISTAAGGINAWVTNLSGNYNNNEFSYLESPCFDFSLINSNPILTFSNTFITETNFDEGWVEVSIDGGNTWTKLIDNGGALEWYNDLPNQWWEGTSSAGPGFWVKAKNRLTGTAAQSAVKLRFVFSSDGSVIREGFGIDSVKIDLPPSSDISMIGIVSPITSCGLGAADSIIVKYSNSGSAPLDTIPLMYSLNSSPLVFDTSFSTILPGDTAVFAFRNTVNLSAIGSYNLIVNSDILGDANRMDDTVRVVFDNVSQVTFPYIEDFETGNGLWTTSGTNNSWAWGAPLATYIPNAGSGINAWVTNLNGAYNNNEFSYLESPCINLTQLTSDPILSFKHIFETETNFDEGWVELSLDGGNTWNKLINNGGAQEWYNDTINQRWETTSSAGAGFWVNASNTLLGSSGNNIRLRFAFSSDGSVTRDGFGVDSVAIDFVTSIDKMVNTIKGLSIYPNPSNGQFTINYEAINSSSSIEVRDVRGKLVYENLLNSSTSGTLNIDLSNHNKGFYFIKIFNEQNSFIEKIIIQ